MTTAEKYADKIIYLVAMHDNIHRRPFLVKLCKEIELKTKIEETELHNGPGLECPVCSNSYMCAGCSRKKGLELELKKLTF